MENTTTTTQILVLRSSGRPQAGELKNSKWSTQKNEIFNTANSQYFVAKNSRIGL